MLAIKCGQAIGVCRVNVRTELRLTGSECAALRRGLVGDRNSESHHTRFPTVAGNHKEVVLFRLISTYLTERDIQAFGAHPRGLFEYDLQIPLPKRERSERREGFFPTQKSFDLVDRGNLSYIQNDH